MPLNEKMVEFCKKRRMQHEAIEGKLKLLASDAQMLRQYFEERERDWYDLAILEAGTFEYAKLYEHIINFMERMGKYEHDFKQAWKYQMFDINNIIEEMEK